METIVLIIHLLLALALVGVVLIQRSEGGGLGIGGGGGGGGFMTTRGTANLLTRTTSILAACFMLTSLGLAWLGGTHREPTSLFEGLPPIEGTSDPLAPGIGDPLAPVPPAGQPVAPQTPAAPLR